MRYFKALTLGEKECFVCVPTRQNIERLKVGDKAPDILGNIGEVTRIYDKREDSRGKLFVSYYVRAGKETEVSNVLYENEINRDFKTSGMFSRYELDFIENVLNVISPNKFQSNEVI